MSPKNYDPTVRALEIIEKLKTTQPGRNKLGFGLDNLASEIKRAQIWIMSLRDQKEGARPQTATTWRDFGLTRTEVMTLEILERGGSYGKTYNQILLALYGNQLREYPNPKIICVRMHHIRRKLLKTGAPFWVETLHGYGFILHRGKPRNRLSRTGVTLWSRPPPEQPPSPAD